MASAIVPIVLAAAPLLEPFIKGAILHAQKWFGYNNGTDQEKLNTVLNAVLSAASSLTAAGKIPDKVTPELAITLIENTIATMKASGILGADSPLPIIQPPNTATSQSTSPSQAPADSHLLGYVYMVPVSFGASPASPVIATGGSSTVPK